MVSSPSWQWDQNSLLPLPGSCLLNPKLLLPLWVNWLIKTGGQLHQGGSGLASCLFVTLRAAGPSHVQQSNRTIWLEPRVPRSSSAHQHTLHSWASQHSISEQGVLRRADLERLSLQIRKKASTSSKKPKSHVIRNAKPLGSSRPRALLSSLPQRSFPGRDPGYNLFTCDQTKCGDLRSF